SITLRYRSLNQWGIASYATLRHLKLSPSGPGALVGEDVKIAHLTASGETGCHNLGGCRSFLSGGGAVYSGRGGKRVFLKSFALSSTVATRSSSALLAGVVCSPLGLVSLKAVERSFPAATAPNPTHRPSFAT